MTLHDILSPWVLLGFAGQGVFFFRFIVQWWASEKEKQVVVPVNFWYISITGTIIILVYAIHIGDIVFSVAQVLSFFVYGRNLQLYYRSRPQASEPVNR